MHIFDGKLMWAINFIRPSNKYQSKSVEKYFYLIGCTLNCMATSSASSSLFFFLYGCAEMLSSLRLLLARPLLFLLCSSSTSLDRAISTLSRLLENSTCCSEDRALNYRSKGYSAVSRYSPVPVSLAAEPLSSLNSLCFLTVASCSSCFNYRSVVGYYLAAEEQDCGGCKERSWGSLLINLENFKAWICFSYLILVICSESSMREVVSANFFSVDCSCCSRQSNLHLRQKFWLQTSTRSFLRSSTSVVRLLRKRVRCFSSGRL